MTEPSAIRRPLTRELEDAGSPVRQFLDARFTSGLRDVQRRYRESAPPLAVPRVPRADADPGTVGTAADWLLRFLICPQLELHLVMGGRRSLPKGRDRCGSGPLQDQHEKAHWPPEADDEPRRMPSVNGARNSSAVDKSSQRVSGRRASQPCKIAPIDRL
jgi:hypothetical protein